MHTMPMHIRSTTHDILYRKLRLRNDEPVAGAWRRTQADEILRMKKIMTYFIENYGCEMNIAESASVEQILIKRGWTKAEDVQLADFVVINTCSVRGSAEERIFGRRIWRVLPLQGAN